jgi:hypothetical protein
MPPKTHPNDDPTKPDTVVPPTGSTSTGTATATEPAPQPVEGAPGGGNPND